MGAPICIGCHARAVNRRRGTAVDKRGPRIVDGVRWNWYCSRPCANSAIGSANILHPHFQAGATAQRVKAERRALKRLVALCKGKMDADQRVHVKDMVRAFMAERKEARLRGYNAGVQRARRNAAYRVAS